MPYIIRSKFGPFTIQVADVVHFSGMEKKVINITANSILFKDIKTGAISSLDPMIWGDVIEITEVFEDTNNPNMLFKRQKG
jgi:hypothetical protein